MEREFLLRSGELLGVLRHVSTSERDELRIELIGEEALKTSAIEGELLNRDSIQASLRQQLGLGGPDRRVPPAEQGMVEMMVDLYQNFAQPLTPDILSRWHKMLMAGGRHIEAVGHYRTDAEPMQIVSGDVGLHRIHFEAPPSAKVAAEMDAFLGWFNGSAPDGASPLPPLIRAGIAHLYFESIHPFEDGNGKVGRAISEKELAQGIRGFQSCLRRQKSAAEG